MMTKAQARAAVEAELERKLAHWGRRPGEFVIIDELTRERPWAWIFFYNSRRFVETRDVRDAPGGNGPFIVNRATGEIRVTGTGRPIEY